MRWVIGDVHGMLRPLEALLRLIERDDPRPQFIFAGDYINRGPDSRGVIELLLSMRNGRFLRGNHDDVFDQVINVNSYLSPEAPVDPLGMYRNFCNHGLVQTLESYGLGTPDIARPYQTNRVESLREIAGRIPSAHRDFFKRLPGFIEDQDFFVVHGKWPPGQKWTPAASARLPLTTRREMLWGRFSDKELSTAPKWSKPGFFGHTPVQSYPGREKTPLPISIEKLTLLDTAAAMDPRGRLTAVSVEGGRVLQADREGNAVA